MRCFLNCTKMTHIFYCWGGGGVMGGGSCEFACSNCEMYSIHSSSICFDSILRREGNATSRNILKQKPTSDLLKNL